VLLLQWLLLLFLSPPLWAAEHSRDCVILTQRVGDAFYGRTSRRPHVHHKSGARGEENDFYRYYTRKFEDNVWGSPLPEDASVPRSGLGVFMILWTSDDEAGRAKLKRCLQCPLQRSVQLSRHRAAPRSPIGDHGRGEHMDEVADTLCRQRADRRTRFEARFNETGHEMFDWPLGYLHIIRTNLYRWPLHRPRVIRLSLRFQAGFGCCHCRTSKF